MGKRKRIQTLDYLSIERLYQIPQEHWGSHEFCFYMHDQIAAMLTEFEESGIHDIILDVFEETRQNDQTISDDVDFFEVLKSMGDDRFYRHHMVSHITLALSSDMLHFLYEALSCFEKRKFTVGFALLRKPLKENMLYLSWLLGDESDFIERFEKNNYHTFDLGKLSKTKKIEILDNAISKTTISEMFAGDIIWDIVFSKKHENGFEPTLQRSTHLVTSMGELLKTEDLSFNMVFTSPFENEYYDFIYWKLSYIMFFILSISLECFHRIVSINERTYSHTLITCTAVYQAIFQQGRRSGNMTRTINKCFHDFMKCAKCNEAFRLNKLNIPRALISEKVECKKCGFASQFPFYWLSCFADITLKHDEDDRSIFNIEGDTSAEAGTES